MKTFIIATAIVASLLVGEIVDGRTGETLPGVSVSYNDTTIYTDFDGRFKIENIPDTLVIEFTSYSDTLILTKTRH